MIESRVGPQSLLILAGIVLGLLAFLLFGISGTENDSSGENQKYARDVHVIDNRLIYVCAEEGKLDEICIINVDGSGWMALTDQNSKPGQFPIEYYSLALLEDGRIAWHCQERFSESRTRGGKCSIPFEGVASFPQAVNEVIGVSIPSEAYNIHRESVVRCGEHHQVDQSEDPILIQDICFKSPDEAFSINLTEAVLDGSEHWDWPAINDHGTVVADCNFSRFTDSSRSDICIIDRDGDDHFVVTANVDEIIDIWIPTIDNSGTIFFFCESDRDHWNFCRIESDGSGFEILAQTDLSRGGLYHVGVEWIAILVNRGNLYTLKRDGSEFRHIIKR